MSLMRAAATPKGDASSANFAGMDADAGCIRQATLD